MHTNILFRKSLSEEGEFESCSRFFPTYEHRTTIPKNSLVIGRYSVLPYYDELEIELALNGSKLINSRVQHEYVADITRYYQDIKDFTPATWENWTNLPSDTSFVIKGKTNSRKFNWKDLMFCQTKSDVPIKANALLNDTFVMQQGIVVREYVPLKRIDTISNGLPISNEYRFFCIKSNIVCCGFYWFEEYDPGFVPEGAVDLVKQVIPIVSKNVEFYVVDVAETEKGEWIVIELNDGQMSGLSQINPDGFYQNLKNTCQEYEY